jgi:hypothetical protein
MGDRATKPAQVAMTMRITSYSCFSATIAKDRPLVTGTEAAVRI